MNGDEDGDGDDVKYGENGDEDLDDFLSMMLTMNLLSTLVYVVLFHVVQLVIS